MAKVLIVDDSRTSRKILRNILEASGHEIVDEATNGEEGYLKCRELRPDIVTMDITMPKMDGIEALKLIKKYVESAKVVMVTAAGQQEKMKEALKSGASEFILKPFNEEDILKVMRSLTE